jgi:WD40 repeat protein
MHENENILKLIMNSYNTVKIRQEFSQIKNKLLFQIILSIFSHEKIYRSLKIQHHALFNFQKATSSFDLLPNGNIITSIIGKGLQLWETNTYTCIKTIKDYEGKVHVLDDTRVLILLQTQVLILSLPEDFKCIKTIRIPLHTYFYNPLLLPNGNLALNRKCKNEPLSIVILDSIDNYNCLKTIICSESLDFVNPKMVGLNTAKLAVSFSKDIQIWNTEGDPKCLETLRGHKLQITSLIYTKDLLVSGSYDRAVKAWDLKEFKCIVTIKLNYFITCLFALSCGFFASGTFDRKIKL